MTGIVLASHGGLAEGLRDTLAMVLGTLPCEVNEVVYLDICATALYWRMAISEKTP